MKRLRYAFTLIELLVVVAIISILAALLMPALKNARDSAKAIQCVNNMRQVAQALTQYEIEYGHYLPAYGLINGVDASNGEGIWCQCLFTQGHYPKLLPNPAYEAFRWGSPDSPNSPPTVWQCPVNPLRIDVSVNGGWSSPNYAPNWWLGWRDTSGGGFYLSSARIPSPERSIMIVECVLRSEPPAQIPGKPLRGWYEFDNIIGDGSPNTMLHRNRGNFGFIDGHVESATADYFLQQISNLNWLYAGPYNIRGGNPWGP